MIDRLMFNVNFSSNLATGILWRVNKILETRNIINDIFYYKK